MNYIKLRKNNLCVENISAQRLAKKYKTPFYCYSLAQLKSNYRNFENAFKSIKPGQRIWFWQSIIKASSGV